MTDLFAIPAQTQEALELARACKYALLAERLADSSGLRWLDNLSLAQLTRRGAPFFWLNVTRCHRASGADHPDRKARLRQLLMTAFDAFFEVLPDGTTWALPAGDDSGLVLPHLGVEMPLPAQPFWLRRACATTVEVETGPGAVTPIPLDPLAAGRRLHCLPIPNTAARLLVSRHPALLPDGLGAEVELESADSAQAELIGAALELIGQADPGLGQQIESRIGWYVPIVGRQPGVHRSFTCPDLGGALFLSAGEDRIQLAEAIVHEYYHYVLYNRMEAQPLLSDDGEARYYSPWREDARPLPMLLHALYVFAGVVELFVRVEALPPLAAWHDRLRQRRRTIAQQLRLGYSQVPAAAFTPAGRQLLQGIEEVIGRHEQDLGLPLPGLPEGLAAHLRRWRQAHPHLAARVEHLG